jgi:hypothetical protein
MDGLTQRDVVAVLTRAPSAGGKSRLFAELGIPPDAALLRALLLDTIDATAVGGRDARLSPWEPASRCDEVRALVGGDVLVIPAVRWHSRRIRMAAVMREMLDGGARGVAPDRQRLAYAEGGGGRSCIGGAARRAAMRRHWNPARVRAVTTSSPPDHVPDLFPRLSNGGRR